MVNPSESLTIRWKNALKLMRIPFSIFLMPVFWFALMGVKVDVANAILVFIVLHVFVYPASNGYNSWFDRDEKSIGGLKYPPKVTKELWYMVLIFDVAALLLATISSFPFALMVLIYLLVSKAYSYDNIRLKKYPVLGALTVVIFQGFWIVTTVQVGCGQQELFTPVCLYQGMVSSLFLFASYPLTQIYQHEEDKKHGDKTLSLLLGIKGTFVFSSVMLFISGAAILYFFILLQNLNAIIIWSVSVIPVIIFFSKWMYDYRRGENAITHKRVMIMNAVSSLSLSAGFILIKISGVA